MSNVSAAILVGGHARRMGGQLKSGLTVGEQTILQRQRDVMEAAGIDEVLLIGRWPAPASPGVRHFLDLVDDAGPLGGLYSALLLATSATVVVVAGDLPFLTASFVTALTDDDRHEATVARVEGRWHPLCAAYRRTVATTIKRRIDRGALRVSDALDDMHVRELSADDLTRLDPSGTLLMNVNTPDDYRHAAQLAQARL